MTTQSPARVSDESHPVRRPIRLVPLSGLPDGRNPAAESPPSEAAPSEAPWDGPVDAWVDDIDGDWDAVNP
ncbi:MAG: hypothetical protein ACRDT4_23550 [Micromonosporaceae bacterium]